MASTFLEWCEAIIEDPSCYLIAADWCEENGKGLLAEHLRNRKDELDAWKYAAIWLENGRLSFVVGPRAWEMLHEEVRRLEDTLGSYFGEPMTFRGIPVVRKLPDCG